MAIPLTCRRRCPLLAVLLFCTGLSARVAGDPADFTYRTNTTEVRLTFSVLDQNSHGVATLQASDIVVVDKGVIVRSFQSFTRSDWTKLEIAILIDGSESVTPHLRREMADILDLVSQSAGVPDENLSIVSFEGSRPALLCAGNCRAYHAAERLPVTNTRGLTPLFDTIALAADLLARRGDSRVQKVLIVFSDGVDTVSRNSLGDAIDVSTRNEIQLECIDVSQPGSWSQGATALRRLASATGGQYFPPPGGASNALNSVLERFRASYIVSYRLPTRASGFHSIRIVPTHNLNLQFRSRSGYYYPDSIR